MKLTTLLIHAIVICLIILFALSPLLVALGAGTIAEANNCQLDEGSVYPCVMNGKDIGQILYELGVLGWLFLATLPLGLAALAIYLVAVVGYYLIKRVRQRN